MMKSSLNLSPTSSCNTKASKVWISKSFLFGLCFIAMTTESKKTSQQFCLDIFKITLKTQLKLRRKKLIPQDQQLNLQNLCQCGMSFSTLYLQSSGISSSKFMKIQTFTMNTKKRSSKEKTIPKLTSSLTSFQQTTTIFQLKNSKE